VIQTGKVTYRKCLRQEKGLIGSAWDRKSDL